MAMEPEDEKDPKRAHVALSMGHELVGPGYSTLTGATTNVTDRGENSCNSSRVNRVSKIEKNYLSRVSQFNQNSSTDRCAGRVSWDGNTEQKIRGSS
jgi:hypothetical protein